MKLKAVAPGRVQIAGMAQVVEQVFVLTLIAHPTGEAFQTLWILTLYVNSREACVESAGSCVPISSAVFLPF